MINWIKCTDLTKKILMAAILFRFLATFTHFGWSHPDEWYETAELGNLITNGQASFTEAIPLHYRNLTWPTMISGALKIANLADPTSISIRIWSIRFLSFLMDILFLIGIAGILKKRFQTIWSLNLSFFFMALFWGGINESVRPSQEHLALALTAFSIHLNINKSSFFSGLTAALIGVAKYSVGFMSLGLVIGFAFENKKSIHKILLGSFLGIFIGGVTDWIFYGRFYESLWMYAQYNLITDLGKTGYGIQSATEYLNYFRGQLRGPLIIIAPIIFLLAPLGWIREFRNKQYWILGPPIFLASQLLSAHKEPRFMIPIFPFLLYLTLVEISERKQIWTTLKPLSLIVATLAIATNIALVLGSTWGEFLKKNWTYLEIDSHLAAHPSTCAVISINRPMSLQLSPKIHAYYPYKDRDPLNLPKIRSSDIPLIWVNQSGKDCDQILVHSNKIDSSWTDNGCTLLSSGLYGILPVAWPFENNTYIRKTTSGPWYHCDGKILNEFTHQQTRNLIYSGTFQKIEPLPGWNSTSVELKSIMKKQSRGQEGGVVVDW